MQNRRAFGIVFLLGVLTTIGGVVAYRQIYGVGEDGRLVQADIARELGRYKGTDFLVEVQGSCAIGDAGRMHLEPLVFDQSGQADGVTVVDRLRKSIGERRGLSIRQVSQHVVEIRWPGVGNDLLGTRVREVKLGEIAQYNPEYAMDAVARTEEFTKVMERLGKKKAYIKIYMELINPPLPTLPHLPATMSDVTVEGALVKILGTFHGVIFYSECSPWLRHGRYDFDYYGPQTGEPAA